MNSTRRRLVAGNWKMNNTVEETESLLTALVADLRRQKLDVEVAVCPPYTALPKAAEMLSGSHVKLGAQDMSEFDNGAYTGEVSAAMLKELRCAYVILGHSERRQHFGDTDERVNRKLLKCLGAGLAPIFCVGETLEQREKGMTRSVVLDQVTRGLAGVPAADAAKLVVAYEPVWAIGTGKTATPEQADEVHREIRARLTEIFAAPGAAIPILYGGSVNEKNAAALFAMSEIDGGLIGGASLKSGSFTAICTAWSGG
jgi:triosephosphate isomerase